MRQTWFDKLDLHTPSSNFSASSGLVDFSKWMIFPQFGFVLLCSCPPRVTQNKATIKTICKNLLFALDILNGGRKLFERQLPKKNALSIERAKGQIFVISEDSSQVSTQRHSAKFLETINNSAKFLLLHCGIVELRGIQLPTLIGKGVAILNNGSTHLVITGISIYFKGWIVIWINKEGK